MTVTEAFEARMVDLLGDGKSQKTLKNYQCAVRSLVRATGDIPIELLGKGQIAVWRAHMEREGYSQTYMRTQYAKLKSVLRFLLQHDMSVMSPSKIVSPKRDTAPRITLDVGEIGKLVDAAKNPRDKAIIALTFLTGARISEVLSITKDQYLNAPLDDKGRQEVVICGKGGKYRPLFLGDRARRYVDEYLETRRNPKTGQLDYYPPLFMSGQNRQITVQRVEQIMHECAANAGLDKRVTPHILRHSFATDLLENEAPLELVSKILGHSNAAMTSKIYSHVNTASQKDTVDKYLSPL